MTLGRVVAVPASDGVEGAGPRSEAESAGGVSGLIWGVGVCAILLGWYGLMYGDCTRYFFHWDDFRLLGAASRLSISGPGDLWRVFWPGPAASFFYRPLSQVGYFWLLRQLFAYDAAPYHAVQLCANVANAVLVYAIASTILQSRRDGLGTALVYAAAPGHLIAVFWNAAFSITGTAFWYFAALLAWLRLRGWPRQATCVVLFCLALLHGEAAITLPLVLSLSALIEKTATVRGRVWALVPLYAIAAAYGAAKVWYFRFGFTAQFPDPMGRAFVLSHYGPTFTPAAVVQTLGFYGACSLSWLYGGDETPWLWTGVGVMWLVALAVSLLLARHSARGRVVLFGLAFFVIALGPLLTLTNHRYIYLIGIAAFGSSLALVAALRALPRVGQWLTVGVVAATVVVEARSAAAVARGGGEFRFLQGDQASAASWLYTVEQRVQREPEIREVIVPVDAATSLVFQAAAGQRLFYGATYKVTPVESLPPPDTDPTRLVIAWVPHWRPGAELPGQLPQWNWLRGDVR
jgi:hypothetical protein